MHSNRKLNIALFFISLFVLLFFLEIFLRLYGMEFRGWLNDIGRQNKVRLQYRKFATDAYNLGVTEKTFNIYFIGESTMWGVPFGPQMSIPSMVEYRLGGSLKARPVRIINFASAAKGASYVRYIFDLLMSRRDVFHPSLVVVYSGHNEFLKFHPTEPDYQTPWIQWLVRHSELARQLLTLICRGKGEILEIGQRDFIDKGIFPFEPKGYGKVVQQYRGHLTHMAMSAKKNDVPMVISTLVSNYSTWEPNRSLFCTSSSAQTQKERFIQTFQNGLAAEKRKDYKAALAAYQEDLSICESFAEVQFRAGKVYEAMGSYAEAWTAFQKAIDYDGLPIRAVSAQNDSILSLSSFGVYAVDSLAYLRSFTSNGLLDERLIIDGMHPNLEGYVLMSEVIAKKIFDLFSSQENVLKPLNAKTAASTFQLDRSKLYEVSYLTGRWITRLASWRYNDTDRLMKAETFFRQAIAINPQGYEGYLGMAVLSLLKENRETAEDFLHQARAIDTKSIDDYFHKPWIRKVIRRSNFKTSVLLPV